jgi:hypothetical protein
MRTLPPMAREVQRPAESAFGLRRTVDRDHDYRCRADVDRIPGDDSHRAGGRIHEAPTDRTERTGQGPLVPASAADDHQVWPTLVDQLQQRVLRRATHDRGPKRDPLGGLIGER